MSQAIDSDDRLRKALSGVNGADQQRIAQVGLEWIDLLLRKNADYGSSAWQVPALAPDATIDAAIRVRMSDKINRIQSLISKGTAPEVAESIDDTMRDLGAYALLWMARPRDTEESSK